MLSVITVCYNCCEKLRKTIESIYEQENIGNNLEYIIIDGKSTDGTDVYAKKELEKISLKNVKTKFVSEKDNGIYDAMNKGIRFATGEWVLLLNAGDVFHSSESIKCLIEFLNNSSADIVYTDYYRVNNYIKKKIIISDIEKIKETMIFCHQAVIVKRKVYLVENYDVRYRLVADYNFLLKCYLNDYKYEHFSYYLVDYDIEGESAKRMIETYKEIYKVRKEILNIKCNVSETAKYLLGILKRKILSIIPQSLRWRLYRIIK